MYVQRFVGCVHADDAFQPLPGMMNAMTRGLVSVIVPVYNREKFVHDALESILAQTYRDIEIVAVNDGSTDGSLEVLQSFQERFPAKVRVLDQSNQGQVVARNAAIAESRGEYIAFLDSDDLWLPDKLTKQMPLFVDNVGLVYCAIYNMDEAGQTLDITPCESELRGHAYHRLLTSNGMTGGSVVLSRAALQAVGVFDVDLSAAENWDLWIRVSKQFSIDYIDEPLVKYRKHVGNMSKNHGLMMNAIEQILAKHCSCDDESTEKEMACRTARANYAYRQGVFLFSQHKFSESRVFFRQALDFQSDYKDSKMRLLRTFLGRPGNRLLSAIKSIICL